MARWKLTEPHYLNVPGTKWEQTITDRATGKQIRKIYNVPTHFHPDVDADCNRRDGFDQFIIVCHEGKGHPDGKDIVFVGDPTPGMLPIDDEARELSSKFAWKPTQGTDDISQSNSFSSQLLGGLLDQMSELQTKVVAVQSPGMDKFMETMAAMMLQQTQILAAIAGKQAVVEPPAEQKAEQQMVEELDLEPVIDEEPPLDDAPITKREIDQASKAAAAKDKASVERAMERVSSRRV
jgi:hypothetical protein